MASSLLQARKEERTQARPALPWGVCTCQLPVTPLVPKAQETSLIVSMSDAVHTLRASTTPHIRNCFNIECAGRESIAVSAEIELLLLSTDYLADFWVCSKSFMLAAIFSELALTVFLTFLSNLIVSMENVAPSFQPPDKSGDLSRYRHVYARYARRNRIMAAMERMT